MRLSTLLLFVSISPAFAQESWPQFRGPGGSGVGQGKTPDGPLVELWRADLAKFKSQRGWSSPIVVGDRIFLTAVHNEKTPVPRKGLYIADLIGKTPPGEHQWKVVCLSRKDGSVIWDKVVHEGPGPAPIHLKNTYASETPVTDGASLYVHFGNLGVFCLDLDGNLQWAKTLPAHKTKSGWGTGASPIVHQAKIYLIDDNEEKSALLAFANSSGKTVLNIPRDEKSNWGTPLLWKNSLRTELIAAGTTRTRSYDPSTGALLWELKGMSLISIPTPIAVGDLLYISSGYVLDPSKPVYAIKPGGKGDISLKPKEKTNDFIVWSQRNAGAYHPTPIVVHDHIHFMYDKGFFACYDAKTGKEAYGKQRMDPARDKFTTSPVALGDRIYVVSEDGDLFTLRAGPKYEVLDKQSLGGGEEMCLATPAIVGGQLLVRTDRALYCLGAKK